MAFTTDTAIAIATAIGSLIVALAVWRSFNLKRLEIAARLLSDHDTADERFADLNRAMYLKCYRNALLADPRWAVVVLAALLALGGCVILYVTIQNLQLLGPVAVGVFTAMGLGTILYGYAQVRAIDVMEKESTQVKILEWVRQEEKRIKERILDGLGETPESDKGTQK